MNVVMRMNAKNERMDIGKLLSVMIDQSQDGRCQWQFKQKCLTVKLTVGPKKQLVTEINTKTSEDAVYE